MVDVLIKKGFKSKFIANKIIIKGEHNELLWSTNFPDAYQWLTN